MLWLLKTGSTSLLSTFRQAFVLAGKLQNIFTRTTNIETRGGEQTTAPGIQDKGRPKRNNIL